MQTSFIPTHPIAAPFALTVLRATSTTPRRARHAHPRSVPAARSLDSYRAGQRFDSNSGTNPNTPPPGAAPSDDLPHSQPNLVPHNPPRARRPPKQHTTLIRALLLLNVASTETCSFLIRRGCVRVNGDVVVDEGLRVDRLHDELSVSGKHIGTVNGGRTSYDDREERAPRTRRDRSIDDETNINRGYNRRVDRGFFSSRKYRAGK